MLGRDHATKKQKNLQNAELAGLGSSCLQSVGVLAVVHCMEEQFDKEHHVETS